LLVGTNGSGKSNVLRAIQWLGINQSRLEKGKTAQSVMVDFLSDNALYTYGRLHNVSRLPQNELRMGATLVSAPVSLPRIFSMMEHRGLFVDAAGTEMLPAVEAPRGTLRCFYAGIFFSDDILVRRSPRGVYQSSVV
jgi:hypothetical protein